MYSYYSSYVWLQEVSSLNNISCIRQRGLLPIHYITVTSVNIWRFSVVWKTNRASDVEQRNLVGYERSDVSPTPPTSGDVVVDSEVLCNGVSSSQRRNKPNFRCTNIGEWIHGLTTSHSIFPVRNGLASNVSMHLFHASIYSHRRSQRIVCSGTAECPQCDNSRQWSQ